MAARSAKVIFLKVSIFFFIIFRRFLVDRSMFAYLKKEGLEIIGRKYFIYEILHLTNTGKKCPTF